MKKRRKLIYLATWIILIFLAAGLFGAFTAKPIEMKGKEVLATLGEIKTWYSFNGTLEAKHKETIIADKPLRIRKINVVKGQLVDDRTILITTYSGEKIKTRTKGEITHIYVKEKAQLAPGSKILDIVDYDNLRLKMQVDEYDLFAISEDKEAVISVHALGKSLDGVITEISKEGSSHNGVTFFTALLDLEYHQNLRVGMSAEAKILDKHLTNITVLPMWAVMFDEHNEPYVYVKEGKDLRALKIELGVTDGINVQVTSGVSPDDSIWVPEKNSDTSMLKVLGF